MPEGDTIHRTAAGLRPYLVGRPVLAARSTRGADVGRLVGSTVTAVDTLGKNLLIRSSNGLTVRTHLRMNGTWHRYRPAEPWRLPASRAALVLEVEGAVAVCFDAPVVEVFETRAQAIHPGLAPLGPDLTDDGFDGAEAVVRLRDPGRAGVAIGEALLDQRVMAGVGNVFRSEILYVERVDPFAPVAHSMTGRWMASSRRPVGCCGPTSAREAGRGARRPGAHVRRPGRRCGSTVGRAGRAGAAERRSAPRAWAGTCRGRCGGVRAARGREPGTGPSGRPSRRRSRLVPAATRDRPGPIGW